MIANSMYMQIKNKTFAIQSVVQYFGTEIVISLCGNSNYKTKIN